MMRFTTELRLLSLMLLALSGCAEPSRQEKYDAAVAAMNAELARLDNLRPAYDAARQAAILEVCKEIAGATPEESATASLEQLNKLMTGAAESQAAADKKPGDIDSTIDQLITAHEAMKDQQSALLGSAGKVNEVMQKIKTPGMPEAKRLEEVLAAKPEVQAYQRQEKRLEQAKQSMLEAEANLPGGPKKLPDASAASTGDAPAAGAKQP
jgi:hypothetical protein